MVKSSTDVKTEQDLFSEGYIVDWLLYRRLKSKAEAEISANGGVLRDLTEFESLIIGGKSHVLRKIYNLLLKYETEVEQTKHCMIKWMQNFKEQIQFNVWEYLWSTNLKLTKCQALKEQWYKMFLDGI